MNYISFLQQLGITTTLSWNFSSSKKLQDEKLNGLLNNIAFSFLPKHSKKHLFEIIKNETITQKQAIGVDLLIEEEFGDIFGKYPIRKTLIDKFVGSLFDWIEISYGDIDLELVKNILKNTKSNNTYFWYILAEKLYDHNKYKENLYLIKKVKKVFKDNFLYEDLILLEIKVIKKLNYIDDIKLLERVCKLSKAIKNFQYDKVLLMLECELLNGGERFGKTIKKYYSDIELFDVDELLNIYELSILSQDDYSILTLFGLLLMNNIYDYEGLDEFDTFIMLKALSDNNIEEFTKAKERKEKLDTYDFRHIKWYFDKVKL